MAQPEPPLLPPAPPSSPGPAAPLPAAASRAAEPLERAARLAVVLNVSAGMLAARLTDRPVARVSDAFRLHGIEAGVEAVARSRLDDALRAASRSDADAIVIGGGDGTLNAGVGPLLGCGKPLGILPLGTRNHFARDLGIPQDLDGAVATVAAGHVREVDVGATNGGHFLNNCSIGLYPAAVRGREELRRRHGHGRWLAMLYACVAVFRRYPLLTVTLRVEDGAARLATPFVFVGNNAYEFHLFALGRRRRVDAGVLAAYLARDPGRLGLLRMAFRALLGRLEQDRDFRALHATELHIETGRRGLTVALDGELTSASPPLVCRVLPRALRVLAPPLGPAG
jgi:diacylglycerol kinase family enzyme